MGLGVGAAVLSKVDGLLATELVLARVPSLEPLLVPAKVTWRVRAAESLAVAVAVGAAVTRRIGALVGALEGCCVGLSMDRGAKHVTPVVVVLPAVGCQ